MPFLRNTWIGGLPAFVLDLDLNGVYYQIVNFTQHFCNRMLHKRLQ